MSILHSKNGKALLEKGKYKVKCLQEMEGRKYMWSWYRRHENHHVVHHLFRLQRRIDFQIEMKQAKQTPQLAKLHKQTFFIVFSTILWLRAASFTITRIVDPVFEED